MYILWINGYTSYKVSHLIGHVSIKNWATNQWVEVRSIKFDLQKADFAKHLGEINIVNNHSPNMYVFDRL